MLAVASSLSDHDLLDHIAALAGKEREVSAELVAHLAASGAMSLTSVRLLHRHLTPENHQDVLVRAGGRSRREIEALVAELAPRPDAPTSVRKLPARPMRPLLRTVPLVAATPGSPAMTAGEVTGAAETPGSVPGPTPHPPTRRPIIENTSPERYRVQFTIGQESHDRLRRLQALLRREIPDGDAGAIVERALKLVLEKVESAKVGATQNPRAARAIRPGADGLTSSRDVARDVKRSAWRRDGGQCAFVSADGHRCTERAFLEFHHVQPYALGGPATADNISLRCRRHNQYEAELVFGRRDDVPKAIAPVNA